MNPQEDLGRFLLNIEKPARYVGGEYGILSKKTEPELSMAIAFPDLYEIGMSNQALRILYRDLNAIPKVSCDRAFAPAPDFEALLQEKGIPLYGLDSGIPLGALDILCFTLGYELGASGILSILAGAQIPLRANERKDDDPIVLLGGPCASNPLPYSRFIDAFWIGEAEAGFYPLIEEIRDLKKAGKGRGILLSHIASHQSVWLSQYAESGDAGSPGNAENLSSTTVPRKASRGVYEKFGQDPLASSEEIPERFRSSAAMFPIPSLKPVQAHGVVEIMRGCPNGCRFCHAGIWYRPMRQKSAERIILEAEELVSQGGFREISLSSLSTGDYRHIGPLLEALNRRFASHRVSFQLPSLKVSTFSLELLEKVSTVRKSGLTFAVETPRETWQLGINKLVSADSVITILREARKNGWRSAKFYFMIGLAPNEDAPEEEEIVQFVQDIGRKTGLHFNINVGTFIPKPHTPFQWMAQLDREAARKKLEYIRNRLKPLGHRVGTQDPLVSTIEGVISRGDARVGELLEEAFARGCRLDAWDEHFRRDIWLELLERYQDLVQETLGARNQAEDLPWGMIDSGSTDSFLRDECLKALAEERSEPCAEDCPHPCGVCPRKGRIRENTACEKELEQAEKAAFQNIREALKTPPPEDLPSPNLEPLADGSIYRMIFSFAKEDRAVWLSHLSIIEVFSMALLRARIPILYTEGFNPLPKLDFASPLSLGIAGMGEVGAADLTAPLDPEEFRDRVNRELPQGFGIREVLGISISRGMKRISLPSILWGFAYESASGVDHVAAKEEKQYRASRLAGGESLFTLRRLEVLAKPGNDASQGISYFDAYRERYKTV